MLTEPEHRAMELLADFRNLVIDEIMGHSSTRNADLHEIHIEVHRLQQRIMAQSAARDHPDKYRLMGCDFS